MTTPGSGAISLWNINQEIGNGSNAISLDWLRGNTKDGIKDLNSSRNRAWYQRNVDGNCNNGNCATNCNCGFGQCICAVPGACGVEADCIGGNCYGNCPACGFGTAVCNNCNCNNCTACYNINCANCDARAWMQGNCNCACTYNCSPTGTVSYNCGNCACLCQCGGNCACGG